MQGFINKCSLPQPNFEASAPEVHSCLLEAHTKHPNTMYNKLSHFHMRLCQEFGPFLAPEKAFYMYLQWQKLSFCAFERCVLWLLFDGCHARFWAFWPFKQGLGVEMPVRYYIEMLDCS
eukprot:c5448_g1_i1 orf=54-410(-)